MFASRHISMCKTTAQCTLHSSFDRLPPKTLVDSLIFLMFSFCQTQDTDTLRNWRTRKYHDWIWTSVYISFFHLPQSRELAYGTVFLHVSRHWPFLHFLMKAQPICTCTISWDVRALCLFQPFFSLLALSFVWDDSLVKNPLGVVSTLFPRWLYS